MVEKHTWKDPFVSFSCWNRTISIYIWSEQIRDILPIFVLEITWLRAWERILFNIKGEGAKNNWNMSHFGQTHSLVSRPLDDLCSWYLDFCDDHLFQHPNNRETGYSNVLVKPTSWKTQKDCCWLKSLFAKNHLFSYLSGMVGSAVIRNSQNKMWPSFSRYTKTKCLDGGTHGICNFSLHNKKYWSIFLHTTWTPFPPKYTTPHQNLLFLQKNAWFLRSIWNSSMWLNFLHSVACDKYHVHMAGGEVADFLRISLRDWNSLLSF